jgi:hypothetical protein
LVAAAIVELLAARWIMYACVGATLDVRQVPAARWATHDIEFHFDTNTVRVGDLRLSACEMRQVEDTAKDQLTAEASTSKRGPKPGTVNRIAQQREALARRLLRTQRGQFKAEHNSETLDRFLGKNPNSKFPGGGSDEYRRDQVLRAMSKMKREGKENS